MNFWQIFVRVFPWRPLSALAALWWQITGRRLRARNLLCAAGAPLPFAYEFWMRNVEGSDGLEQRAKIASQTWDRNPKFLVILDARNSSAEAIQRSIRSVERQAFPHWTIFIVAPEIASVTQQTTDMHVTSSWRIALSEGSGDFIVPLKCGNELSSWALLLFAEALQSTPTATIIYRDEDEIDSAGRRTRPWFKPRWNEELFLAKDYISRACAISSSAARKAAPKLDFKAELTSLD